jgi:methionyl-tRNA formyltransferase
MTGDRRLRVVLFALTGFGNPVLKALLNDARVQVKAVFTVKYENPFPYYQEQQLCELCEKRRVICYHGVQVSGNEGIQLLREHAPDLIIVSTFKQILKENVLQLPALGVVNLHPSLLPRYRGPCPTQAVLLDDEMKTGVTGHYITEKLDEGDVLLQRSMVITEVENDGQLRRKLANLAGQMIPELVGMFAGFTKPAGTSQDHSLATYAPRPTIEDGYLNPAIDDINTIRRKLRAFNPLPGTSIRIGDQRVAVNRFDLFQDSRADGFYENREFFDLITDSRAIRMYKRVN